MKVPADKQPLISHLFCPQQFAQKEHHLHVGFTPYVLAEVRLLMQGASMIAGVPLDLCKGDSVKEKIENVMSSDGVNEFMHLATNTD